MFWIGEVIELWRDYRTHRVQTEPLNRIELTAIVRGKHSIDCCPHIFVPTEIFNRFF